MSSTRPTVREWHWVDEPEPRPIPESWSNQGVEPSEDGEEHWYAVAYQSGRQIEVEVDRESGDVIDGPRRTDERVAVVYVRGDARRAVVREVATSREGSDLRPSREYKSVRAIEGSAGGPVYPQNEGEYISTLRRLYGVDPLAVPNARGGWS